MENKLILKSESGSFICNEQGVALEFEPAPENMLEERCYKTMIVPEGVTGFASDFGNRITVTERFVLPETLMEIGDYKADALLSSAQNIFAGCRLPTVIIPESVRYLGLYAFGGSRINTLCLPTDFKNKITPYNRQFKDAKIRTVFLHEDAQPFRIDGWYDRVFSYQTRAPLHLPEAYQLTEYQRPRYWEEAEGMGFPWTHSMKLDSRWFRKIATGEKTVELRLYDEKRQLLREGDGIVFTDLSTGEQLQTRIVKLHLFPNFKMLYEELPLTKCGYSPEDAANAKASDMEAYYSAEEQRRWGVVGIEIALL